MMSLARHPPNGQQSQAGHHDQKPYQPQLDDCNLTSQTFLDFVTPNKHSTISITGAWQSLESLNHALSPDIFARHSSTTFHLSAYTPLTIALNHICEKVGMGPINEHDLAQLHQSSWFLQFAKHAVKQHSSNDMLDLNLEHLTPESCLSEDQMWLLVEAFGVSNDLTKIELGVVAITNQGVKAFHYPWTAACNGLTAWVVADCRNGSLVYYGLGPVLVDQQEDLHNHDDQHGEEDDLEESDDDGDNNLQSPSTTRRKTAARVLAQQIPLPANLSARDILENHTGNLQYINVLKVGLNYSNQEIAIKVAEKAGRESKKFSGGASGIVKRINTGIDYIEKEYNIDAGAFRTAYDRERKANGISTRTKDEANDQVLATNKSKIRDAMAWIQTGGPRPDANISSTTTQN
ncbi:hypothetical protein E4T48_00313 [Aureobasidium sp. EXF-10727]|nr:hypothetical protein E4T48_00313 [Aureobasidium sp. EXF-10727]KAI4729759.1 hypothetical protein E4T49_02366 [Aureobasidium sp. EXF-10728]